MSPDPIASAQQRGRNAVDASAEEDLAARHDIRGLVVVVALGLAVWLLTGVAVGVAIVG